MAIGFDALTSNTASPTSFSHTTNGSNRVMVLVVASGADDVSATYNGTGLTKQASAQVPVAGDWITILTLLNPALGSNTVSVSGTSISGSQAGTYTGVDAVSGANSGTGGVGGISVTYTVTAANSYVVSSGYGRNGPHALAASTGIANDRYGLTTNGIGSFGDSGAVSVNTATTWSNAGSPNPNDNAQVGIVLEPSAAAVTLTTRKTLLKVGT